MVFCHSHTGGSRLPVSFCFFFADLPPTPVGKPGNPCDPSPCGPNSRCLISPQGFATCSCLPGYRGSPPLCKPECIVSTECPLTETCINQKCVSPCGGICGRGANCYVMNHNPICNCPPGHVGDPFVMCVLPPGKWIIFFFNFTLGIFRKIWEVRGTLPLPPKNISLIYIFFLAHPFHKVVIKINILYIFFSWTHTEHSAQSLRTIPLWSEFHLPSTRGPSSLLVPSQLPRNPSVLSTRVRHESGVFVQGSVHQRKMSQPLHSLLRSKCTVWRCQPHSVLLLFARIRRRRLR